MIRFLKVLSVGLLALAIALLSAGCGSGSTQVRLMNAMNGESSVNMLIANSAVASGVVYGTASSYAKASSGSQTVQIQSGGVTLLNSSLSFSGGNNNTVLATDSGATVFTDDRSTPPTNDIEIRVINASNSLGPADVYVVPSNTTDISTIPPTATLAFQAASNYIQLAAGSYEVLLTQSTSKNVIIDSNPLSLSAGQVRTVVSLDGNGVFSTAVLSDLN